MCSVITALGLVRKGMISFVGAGGKTTLMLKIAEELALTDDRILITTTTKIWPPDSNSSCPLIIAKSKQGLLDQAEEGFIHSRQIIAASHHCKKTNKLIGFEPGFVDELWQSGQFNWILTEADGSARKPIKAPDDHEPVIPRQTSYLCGLIGLSALGKVVSEKYVHRSEKFAELTELPIGEYIDLAAISKLIKHKKGLFKSCPDHARTIAFLNQADTLTNLNDVTWMDTLLNIIPAEAPDLLVLGQTAHKPFILKLFPQKPLKEKGR